MNNLISNPFTRQFMLTNAWTEAARKASAASRKRKSNMKKAYGALQSAAGDVEIKYLDQNPIGLADDTRKMWGHYAPSTVDAGRAIGLDEEFLRQYKIPLNPPRIMVGKGHRLERAIAAHEVGHATLKHVPGEVKDYIGMESDAWKWAIKNRNRLRVSKRKLFQALRSAEAATGVSAGTLFGLGKKFARTIR
jgi:hypothetical protein